MSDDYQRRCHEADPEAYGVDIKDIAHLAQALRDARPDPHTRKVSFLLGWDAAIAELERNG